MKDPKDIEKLFEQADQQLTQQPPAAAWDKLSNKLDKHDQESALKVVPLTRRFPAWQVAASLLLLVGLFYFATNQLNVHNESAMADASGKVVLEDVPMEDDPSGFYALAVKCTQYYNTSPSTLIADQPRSRSRLRLAERTNRYAGDNNGYHSTGDGGTEDLAIENDNNQNAIEQDLAFSTADWTDINENGFGAEDQIAADADIKETDDTGSSIAAASAAESDYKVEEKAVMVDEEMSGEDEEQVSEDIAMAQPARIEAIESTAAGRSNKRSSQARKKDAAAAGEEVVDLNVSSNVMVYSEDNASLGLEEISSFQWLIGQWSAQNNGQQVQQQWTQKDQFTLQGKAIFSVNGQEIQVQKMEIKKGENGIYFILANLADNTTQKYRLKSMEAYQAIFAGSTNNEEFIFQQLDNNQFNNFTKQLESQSMLKNNATPFNNLNFSRVNKE